MPPDPLRRITWEQRAADIPSVVLRSQPFYKTAAHVWFDWCLENYLWVDGHEVLIHSRETAWAVAVLPPSVWSRWEFGSIQVRRTALASAIWHTLLGGPPARREH